MITDTLLSLRPSFVLYNTVAEANEALIELERKFRSKLGDIGVVGDDDSDEDEEHEAHKIQEEGEDEVCFV